MSTASACSIVIADDHPLVRDALRQAIGQDLGGAVFRDAASLQEVDEVLRGGPQTDLLLLDLHMPGMRGFTGLCYLRAQFPDVPIAMISASTESRIVRQAIDYGAAGFIPKSAPVDEIRVAVRALLSGDRWISPGAGSLPATEDADARLALRLATLTPQQLRVLAMLAEGKLNKQIAFDLEISEATVKSHVSAILQKLEVNSRTQAVIMATRLAVDDPTRDLPVVGAH